MKYSTALTSWFVVASISLIALGIIEREIVHNVVEDVFHDGGSGASSGPTLRREALQPAHFDQHAEADQAVLAEYVAEPADLVGIAAVGRREGSQR